jgi:hypothetical protein
VFSTENLVLLRSYGEIEVAFWIGFWLKSEVPPLLMVIAEAMRLHNVD